MVFLDWLFLGKVDIYLFSGLMEFIGYIWFVRGIFILGYGWWWGRMYRGIDIVVFIGILIVVAVFGIVIYVDWNSGGYGYLVEI